jgi:hypothetical protein
MHHLLIERACRTGRHDFDALPRNPEVDVRPANRSDLTTLAEMANRLVPGVQIGEVELKRYFAFDPESILTFSRKGKLLGAVAFLYLNHRGHDALIFDEMSLTHPEMGLLADGADEVSAIYVWAIAGLGRAMAGLGNVSQHLSGPRYAAADLFAHPTTKAGRDLMVTLGFHGIPSFQPDLWCYQRPWNRLPRHLPGPRFSIRSQSDARR